MKFTMCQNPPADEIYIPYCGGKLHHIEMPPSHTNCFSNCFMGLEALGFARLIGSDHNNSVSILQEALEQEHFLSTISTSSS
jgi:hypothetical protein